MIDKELDAKLDAMSKNDLLNLAAKINVKINNKIIMQELERVIKLAGGGIALDFERASKMSLFEFVDMCSHNNIILNPAYAGPK